MRLLRIFILLSMSLILAVITQPILQFDIALSDKFIPQTTFLIGDKQTKVSLDIDFESLEICCKNKDSLYKKIYYFATNPFFQSNDYACKHTSNSSIESDSAKFKKIGVVPVQFKELVYPDCNVGRIGFNKQSQILSSLPQNQQFFVIQPTIQPKNQWKLKVGGDFDLQYNQILADSLSSWTFEVSDSYFNDLYLGSQTVKFVSQNIISIPTLPYLLIRNQLIQKYNCISNNISIFCPCVDQINLIFPNVSFAIGLNQINITPTSYFVKQDEICLSKFIESEKDNNWQINLFCLNNYKIRFSLANNTIGFQQLDKTYTNDNSSNLQMLLNSFVILLLCVFVALIFIEIIKRISGIQNAHFDSFETYMLKKQ